jgi:rubrerythrin
MKTYLILPLFMLLGLQSIAQNQLPIVPNKSDELLQKPEAKETYYCCQKCNYTAMKAGICPVDRIPLIQEGTYYCPVCSTTSAKPGKCPKCGKPMKKMETPTKEANISPLKKENK